MPLQYPPQQRPPTSSALSRSLAARCGLTGRFPDEDPTNLQRVALFYEIERSRQQLVEEITRRRADGQAALADAAALAELGFPLVITTNYDQLFEDALARRGQAAARSVYTPKLEPTTEYRDPTAESPIVFKIHGDIDHPETVVVTDEDYIQFVLRMSNKDPYDPVPLKLKADLTELDDAVRRLQPARLQPASAFQDAALEDRPRERAGHVLGGLPRPIR